MTTNPPNFHCLSSLYGEGEICIVCKKASLRRNFRQVEPGHTQTVRGRSPAERRGVGVGRTHRAAHVPERRLERAEPTLLADAARARVRSLALAVEHARRVGRARRARVCRARAAAHLVLAHILQILPCRARHARHLAARDLARAPHAQRTEHEQPKRPGTAHLQRRASSHIYQAPPSGTTFDRGVFNVRSAAM